MESKRHRSGGGAPFLGGSGGEKEHPSGSEASLLAACCSGQALEAEPQST